MQKFKKYKKHLATALSCSIIASNVMPAFANNDQTITENSSQKTEVTYNKASAFSVTIPKNIYLGSNKQAGYSVTVQGDIASDQEVYVVPVDSSDVDGINFYMKDQNTKNSKPDVLANITHNKTVWNFQDVADSYTETSNAISAPDLTSGTWMGTFNFEINTNILEPEMPSIDGLEDGGTYDIGTSITIKDGEILKINDEIVEIPDNTYIFNEEGNFKVSVSDTNENEVSINITIKHTHTYVDNVCTGCGDTRIETQKATIDNLIDGGTYATQTAVSVPKNSVLKVNNKSVSLSNNKYTFEEEGTYNVALSSDEEPETSLQINISDSAGTSIDDLVNNKTYSENTTINVGDGEKLTINGEEINLTDGKYTFDGEGSYEVTTTDKDGNKVIVVVVITHSCYYTEKVTKEATYTEDGEKTYTCIKCKDTITEVIPKLVDTTAPTGSITVADNVWRSFLNTITFNTFFKNTQDIVISAEDNESGIKEIAYYLSDSEVNEADLPNLSWTIYTDKIAISPNNSYVIYAKITNNQDNVSYLNSSGIILDNIAPSINGLVDGETYPVGTTLTIQDGETLKINNVVVETTDNIYTFEEEGESIKVTVSDEAENEASVSINIEKGLHIHKYKDTNKTIEWENTSNGTYSFVKNGNTWTSNNKGVRSSTATSTWTITLDKDMNYSFQYKVSSESYDKLTIKLDDTTVANAISGNGTTITYNTTLSAGTHTITATYKKDSSGDRNDDCGYITLDGVLAENVCKCIECEDEKEHNYRSESLVTATCQKAGKIKYTCSDCGRNYIKTVFAHIFDKNVYTLCGMEVAPDLEYQNWNYTLDEENAIITLNYYKGNETDVLVYGAYEIDGMIYNTQLADNTESASTNYMFAGKTNIQSIAFGEGLDTSNLTNISRMFYNCQALVKLDLSNLNTSNVTNMNYMFFRCSSLENLDVSTFDTSNVTNFSGMFNYCLSLTSIDVSNFDTSNADNMSYMFGSTSTGYTGEEMKLEQIIGLDKFDTSNVTNMSYMFADCQSLTNIDVSNFNTSKVTDMSGMFVYCKALTNLDLTGFDTSNVTEMRYMFSNCIKLTSLDVTDFDTSNVTSMAHMFESVQLTSLDVTNFNTSNVVSMNSMFHSCSKLTSLNVTNFDTNKVYDMEGMFDGCRSLKSLNLSNFNTSNVRYMNVMFISCVSLTSLNVSNFDTSKVTNMSQMFNYCSSLTSLNLRNWDTTNTKNMYYMFGNCTKLKTIYVTRGKWSTSLAASESNAGGMFNDCGTSSVTYG